MTKNDWKDLREMMMIERKKFLDSIYTSENEVKRKQIEEYIIFDGYVVWLPEYYFRVKKFLEYKLSGKI